MPGSSLSPRRAEQASPESRRDSPSPPRPSTYGIIDPSCHICTRRRVSRRRSQRNQGQEMERQPAGGGASQAACGLTQPEADWPYMSGAQLGAVSVVLESPTRQGLSASPPPPLRPRQLSLHSLLRLVSQQTAMAPPPSQQPEAAAAVPGAISKVLIVMAMEKEAMPLVYKFNLVEAHASESIFPKGAPWTRFYGKYKDIQIDLVMPGKDAVSGVDSVGTVSAALVTYASIQALKPDLIINAGTAGGFKAKGACVKDVFLASDVAFHDRRIPIPVFDMYGVGARKTLAAPNILKELNFKLGKLSTGDSLDMSPEDEKAIQSNDATIKDMEGAAVAYVADMFSTPAIFVKAVTDIVDGDKPTAEEFLQNLISVTAALDEAVTKVVEFISSGKRCSDL